jgi:hypothetical protein
METRSRRARRRRRRRPRLAARRSALLDFVVRPRPTPEPRRPRRGRAGVPHDGRDPHALEVELGRDERVFVAGIDVGAGGNVFGLTRGCTTRSATACATPRSRRRDHGPRRRRGDGGMRRWSS